MNCVSPGLIWGPIVYGSFHDNEEMMVRPHGPSSSSSSCPCYEYCSARALTAALAPWPVPVPAPGLSLLLRNSWLDDPPQAKAKASRDGVTPTKAQGTVWDCALCAVYLASDESREGQEPCTHACL